MLCIFILLIKNIDNGAPTAPRTTDSLSHSRMEALQLPWCIAAVNRNDIPSWKFNTLTCMCSWWSGDCVKNAPDFNMKIHLALAFACLSVDFFVCPACPWTHHSYCSWSTAIWRSMVTTQLRRSYRGTAHRSALSARAHTHVNTNWETLRHVHSGSVTSVWQQCFRCCATKLQFGKRRPAKFSADLLCASTGCLHCRLIRIRFIGQACVHIQGISLRFKYCTSIGKENKKSGQ